jgi:hypothetical protein
LDYVSVEHTQTRTLAQSMRGRILGDRGDAALTGWFKGFTRTRTGNFVGEFFLAKKSSDVVIMARINLFKSDRTTRPGCPWTWSIQITDGPRRMIMEMPAYSNLYFEGPHEAAISVRDDLRGGGYIPAQPARSSVVTEIARKQIVVDRVAAAEDRAFPQKSVRTRIIDT